METKKLSIVLLIALVGFPQISETIYTPALPSVAAGLMTTASMAEASLAIYFVGFALGILLWGTISDRIGRRSAMLLGLVTYGLGSFGCANAGSIEELLTWRLIQAFGGSVGSVVTQTILRDAFEGTERTKLFSVMSGALSFSPAVGPLLGGFISELFGWRANFWVLVVLSAVLFVWTFTGLRETRPKDIPHLTMNTIGKLCKAMGTSRQLWGHVLLIAGTNGIIFGFYQEAPFAFIEQLGMQPSHYGLFGILIASATILASKVSYRQNARFSSESIIQLGAACVLAGSLLFTSAVVSGLFSLTAVGILSSIIPLFFIFFGIGLIIPNSLSLALKPFQMAAGTAGSIFGGFYYSLIALCTWVMSIIHNGTTIPLPLYITFLGVVLTLSSLMVRNASAQKMRSYAEP